MHVEFGSAFPRPNVNSRASDVRASSQKRRLWRALRTSWKLSYIGAFFQDHTLEMLDLSAAHLQKLLPLLVVW